MIDRLPKCLHTCLHCSHAVICEEYTAYTRKLVFDGCWKTDSIHLPVAREDCDKFEESPDRVKRKFWEKWNWKVYVDKDLVEQVRPEEEPGEVLEQESERGQGEVREQLGEQGHSGPEQLKQESDQPCEQPIVHIKDLPQGPGLSLKGNAHSNGSGHVQKEEKEDAEVGFVRARELLNEYNTKEEREKSGKVHGQPTEKRKNTTRALIIQALTSNLTKLKDIAYFAAVDPSTAHYHLRNLIRQERVIKLSWGRYTFPDSPALKETGQFFEKFLKNSSQSIRVKTGYMELHPIEKSILVDILSKDNRYLRLSERELARRSNISRYKVKKYTHKLEKKRLITIEREGKQLIFTPIEVAINAFSAFLHSEKTGSKIDSSFSKVQPITSKNWSIINGKGEVNEGDVLQDQFDPDVSKGPDGQQGTPSAAGSSENEYLTQDTAPEDPGRPDTSPQNVLQTFEDYIAWQQKNAHRLIIQFKLIRCNHNRLKGTGWIFGKKS
ncbi:MAG: winged helix-turn-helix domain-containing protein, partial [Theionarchaea archaeon]|nr:winged helix-turn-helix domain-containing protein [Theionarchaea archaeon]